MKLNCKSFRIFFFFHIISRFLLSTIRASFFFFFANDEIQFLKIFRQAIFLKIYLDKREILYGKEYSIRSRFDDR